MNITKKFMVALALAIPLTVTATAAARAGQVWEECIQYQEGTENEKCTRESTGDFEFFEVLSPVTTSSEGTLKLVDKKGGSLKEEVAVECTVTEVGAVGAGASDETTEAKATGCRTVAGKCETPSAQAVNLPWQTELTESEAETRDSIKTPTRGPGWKVTCGKTEDTCEGATSAKITNNTERATVEAIFDAKSAKETCSVGGKETGEISGTEKVAANESHVLGISAQPQPRDPHWYSNGAILRETNEAGALRVRTGTGIGPFTMVDSTLRKTAGCELGDAGRIWNPAGGGPGLATFSAFSPVRCSSRECAAPTLIALNIANWRIQLWPVRNGRIVLALLSRAELELSCNGAERYTEQRFGLPLKVANGGGAGEAACTEPTHTTWMEFNAHIDVLLSARASEGSLAGTDCIWGEAGNERIEVRIP